MIKEIIGVEEEMVRLEKTLRDRIKTKPDEYYCCLKNGYLFHNYSEFQEFIDIDDDSPSDLIES